MCLRPNTILVKPDSSYCSVLHHLYPSEGYNRPFELQVPCGKCVECMRNRQDQITARIYQASKDYSKLHFITLTYREQNLPLARSVWKVNRSTGEEERYTYPEIIPLSERSFYTDRFFSEGVSFVKSNKPRVIDFPIESWSLISDSHDYFERVTPSVNPADFNHVFKQWRIQYERKFGSKLPDFKYVAVAEYGSKKTMRPHIHCVILSNDLTDYQVRMLGGLWFARFGRYDLRSPSSRYSVDGKDQYSLIAQYVGKYVSKGSFEISTVRQKLALKMRLCASKKLGRNLSEDKKREFLCKDFVGEYDVWKAHEIFSPEVLDKLCENIALRSFYSIQYKVKSGENRYKYCQLPFQFKLDIYEARVSNYDGKILFPPLYYMVSRFVRNQHIEDRARKLEQIINSNPPEQVSKALDMFFASEEYCTKVREQAFIARQKKFYAEHSKVN